MIEIRGERPEDVEAITFIHEQAFGRSNEATLVRILRTANKAVVSLVAAYDGQLVGHILFSQVTIYPPRAVFSGIGLAPVAVVPTHQGRASVTPDP